MIRYCSNCQMDFDDLGQSFRNLCMDCFKAKMRQKEADQQNLMAQQMGQIYDLKCENARLVDQVNQLQQEIQVLKGGDPLFGPLKKDKVQLSFSMEEARKLRKLVHPDYNKDPNAHELSVLINQQL